MTSSRFQNQPRPVSELISANPGLNQLIQADARQRSLLEQVKALLPQPLSQHCLAVVQTSEKLVLYTDSSAWASRFRFLGRELAQKLRDQGVECRQLKVRILPSRREKPARTRRLRRMSERNARLLSQVADSLSDPLLAASLRRLARHAEKRDEMPRE